MSLRPTHKGILAKDYKDGYGRRYKRKGQVEFGVPCENEHGQKCLKRTMELITGAKSFDFMFVVDETTIEPL